MQRFTISLDDPLAAQFDALIAKKGYVNRSEAVRDLIRTQLGDAHVQSIRSSWCVASLSYVYDHHDKTVAERVQSLQHDHHDLVVTSLHTHLDHQHCMETVVLKGPTQAVNAFSQTLVALRGVRHGSVHTIALDEGGYKHIHPPMPATRGLIAQKAHLHFKPIS